MKGGIVISASIHALVLAGAMVSLASPPPLQVADVESVEVDVVQFEELTKAVQGDREAALSDTPASKPTTKPQTRPEAENVGNADDDRKAEAEREAPEPPVEKTETPAPSARPEPQRPTPVPTPKLAPDPEPKKDIAMLLKEQQSEEPPQEEVVEDELALPKKVATPKARPSAPKPEIAKTNERKKEEAAEAAAKAEEQRKAKEVAKAEEKKKAEEARKKAVINRAQAAAGGAKRSNKTAALGTRQKSNASKLAQSEIDALRGRLEGCWNAGHLAGHPDAAKMRAKVEFKLTRDGQIDGRVKVRVSGTDRSTRASLAVNVRSAVIECAPYNLPAEKYETWADVTVNFSLADML